PGFADAARLDYVGHALGRPHVETLFAKPLRAASDSTALVEPLGRLVAELQNLGYLDARARAGWESTSREPALEVVVEEGQRMRWSSVVLEAPNPADSLAMTAALGLEPGAWASPAALREGIERCVSQVAARGYPYAQLTVTSFEWDGSGARLRMSGSRGPEVTVSRLRFEGLKATRASLAERSAGRLKGKPFDRAAAEAGRLRLERLGLFNQVSYEGLEGEADWSRGQLVYRVTEPRYNRLEGAIGREGQGRAVGLLRVELDNLAGTGRAAGLTWESRGGGVASFGARYAEPLVGGGPVGSSARPPVRWPPGSSGTGRGAEPARGGAPASRPSCRRRDASARSACCRCSSATRWAAPRRCGVTTSSRSGSTGSPCRGSSGGGSSASDPTWRC